MRVEREMTAGSGQQVAFNLAPFRDHFLSDKLHGGLEVMEPKVLGSVHAKHLPHHRRLGAERDERVRQQRPVCRAQTVPGHQHRLRASHLVQHAQRGTDIAHALQRASVVVHAAVAAPVARVDGVHRDLGHVAGLAFQSEHATLRNDDNGKTQKKKITLNKSLIAAIFFHMSEEKCRRNNGTKIVFLKENQIFKK